LKYNSTILLYGYETWSLSLRDEHTLIVSENRILRKKDVAGGWRRIHSEKLHNGYFDEI
jgi:hypothetical protein